MNQGYEGMNRNRVGNKGNRRRNIFLIRAGVFMVAIVVCAGLYFGMKEAVAGGEKPESEEAIVLTQRISGPDTAPIPFDRTRLMPGTNFSIGAGGYAYHTQQVRNWTKGKEVYTGKKIAFLTFDDGPTKVTEKVLDILKARNVPGNFFLNGKTVDTIKDKSVFERYIAEGHGIATHSYSHVYGYLYPGKVARADRHVEEYEKSLSAMKKVFGEGFETMVYRYPGGSGSWKEIQKVHDVLRQKGVEYIDWNSLSGDTQPAGRRPESPEAMAAYVLETLKDNRYSDVAVVLMHDTLSATPGYLDHVIDALEGEGFAFGILR
jgi:peptidoglycan/xylan/chitin deacetylase (PgdA/CDA1 family)